MRNSSYHLAMDCKHATDPAFIHAISKLLSMVRLWSQIFGGNWNHKAHVVVKESLPPSSLNLLLIYVLFLRGVIGSWIPEAIVIRINNY